MKSSLADNDPTKHVSPARKLERTLLVLVATIACVALAVYVALTLAHRG